MRFLTLSEAGAVVTREVKLPAEMAEWRWLGTELVVMLERPKNTVEVGRITATGYDKVVQPKKRAWKHGKQSGEEVGPHWQVLTTANEIWLGSCHLGYLGDGDDCTEWTYARLAPRPITFSGEAPSPAVAAYPDIPTAPSPAIDARLVASPASAGEPARSFLRCTSAAGSLEYPAPDERSAWNVRRVRWLSTEPPIFQIEQLGSCEAGECPEWKTFEGCKESVELAETSYTPGPGGVFALATKAGFSLRRAGRELAVIKDAGELSFVPGQR